MQSDYYSDTDLHQHAGKRPWRHSEWCTQNDVASGVQVEHKPHECKYGGAPLTTLASSSVNPLVIIIIIIIIINTVKDRIIFTVNLADWSQLCLSDDNHKRKQGDRSCQFWRHAGCHSHTSATTITHIHQYYYNVSSIFSTLNLTRNTHDDKAPVPWLTSRHAIGKNRR